MFFIVRAMERAERRRLGPFFEVRRSRRFAIFRCQEAGFYVDHFAYDPFWRYERQLFRFILMRFIHQIGQICLANAFSSYFLIARLSS